MENEKIYDLEKNDYPNQRGDTFRTLQVSECWICGALSNKVVIGGSPGYGTRVICPQIDEEWHAEMAYKVESPRWPYDASYNQALPLEISNTRKAHQNEIKHDLTGGYDLTKKQWMTNVWSRKFLFHRPNKKEG